MSKKKLRGLGERFENYIFFMLIALEILMSFTFLGYIHITSISITCAYIPVLIAGCLLGIKESTALGMLFGVASCYKASAYYVMDSDQLFSPLLSDYPVKSILLSVGVRVLFGFLIGIFFYAAKKTKHAKILIGVIALLASEFQAILVYGAIEILFPNATYSSSVTFEMILSNILVSILCFILIEFVWTIYNSKGAEQLRASMEYSTNAPYEKWHIYEFVGAFIACILAITTLATVYFSQRTVYMLGTYNVIVSSQMQYDFFHLQTQFLISMISLNFMMALFFVIIYKYMAYREYLGELDHLTGIMGRKMFLYCCDKLRKDYENLALKEGYFMFLDVDCFKLVNDTYGHPVGDFVLQKVASNLEETFSAYGNVGRMGGDEFAVIIKEDLSIEEVEQKLDDFLENVSHILEAKQRKITCSIGVCHFTYPKDTGELLSQTDKILYRAKANGRACYIIDDFKESNVEQ